MLEIASSLSVALYLSVVANRLVEGLAVPLFAKLRWDRFWLMYVAWLAAAVLVGFAEINLFSKFIPNETVGRLFSALCAGGGANFLADIAPQSKSSIPKPVS